MTFALSLRMTGDKHRRLKYPWPMLLALAVITSLQIQAQELFSNQSSNPSAAQFRNVRTVGNLVCGEINKPNQQGGYEGFVRFAFRTQGDWAIERGAYYRFAENGRQMDTKFMSEDASREEQRDLVKASELLDRANAANSRLDQLFRSCT